MPRAEGYMEGGMVLLYETGRMGKVTWCGNTPPREHARRVKRETGSVITDKVLDIADGVDH
jgi:hypothetical protein